MDINEALREGNDDAVISHIEKGYDANTDPDKLLMRAAHYGREKVLKASLEFGISPNSYEALLWACGKGRLSLVKLLVSAGANVNIADKYGRTPITASAAKGKLAELKFLMENGGIVDGALLAAVNGERIKIVNFLIEMNVDLEEVGNNGLSALAIACASHRKKSKEIALLLIGAGANVNFVRASDEQTPLKFAASHSSPEVIQALIESGAEIDGPIGTAQTALMLAARSNSVARVDALLKNGANPDLQCGLSWANNCTARGLAEMENRQEVVKYFDRLGKSNC